jgi:mannose-6-phosphate isomerase
VIDFAATAAHAQRPQGTDQPGRQRLVDCDKFVLDSCELDGTSITIGGDDRCHILVAISGSAALSCEAPDNPLVRGSVVVMPAQLGPVELHAPSLATLLDAYLP